MSAPHGDASGQPGQNRSERDPMLTIILIVLLVLLLLGGGFGYRGRGRRL